MILRWVGRWWVWWGGGWGGVVFFFFFFQAEDGIRDWSVTGVQTCALPIWGNGTNDIDASSRFGEAGTVSLNELGTDPTQAAAELPDNTGAPDISQECNARAGVSRFVATGRGGSPPETMLPGLLWETLETVGEADGDRKSVV